MAAVPNHLISIASRVDERLQREIAVEIQRWADLDGLLADPVFEIERLVSSGGKRLRPAFCYWGFIAAGGDASAANAVDGVVTGAGAAIELTHASALFHDDVLDDADARRGAETTHRRFERLHAEKDWDGESRRYGEGIAILVGDIAAVLADRFLVGVPQSALELWNELRIELNIGQLLDITGSVRSVERPLHLGAALVEGRDATDVIEALSAYGLPLGDAFQMRDDVMGAFGDTEVTGKPVGGDLREGKPTPLLARAVALANSSQRKILDKVGSSDLSDEQVAQIQQTIIDVGAINEIERLIATNISLAVQALDSPVITSDAIEPLVELAEFITDRSS
jgi:geranylgeranyl diphosphate synthase type I